MAHFGVAHLIAPGWHFVEDTFKLGFWHVSQLIVYAAEATALIAFPVATAIAFSVVVELIVSPPEYAFDEVVGVVPSVV